MQRSHQIQDLLAHADWLSALAARLVRDGDADDVVQETWKAALSTASPVPVEDGPARAWLTTVVRNFARRRWRSGTARRARERVADVPAEAAAASPEEVLVRAQLQRTLADLVLALDEPYRSAVVLRYYEGKSAAEIARALGVPAGTVRWRLKEGIDRLRARMDAKYDGDRARWRALVGTLALPAVTASRGGEGVMVAMTTKVKVTIAGLAVLLAVAVGAVFFLGAGDGGRQQATGPRARPAVAPGERRAALPLESRVLLAEGATAGGVGGVVRDPAGAVVAGALVALSRQTTPGVVDPARGLAATARTDGGGRFAFDDPFPGAYRLTASSPGHRAAVSNPLVLAAGQRQEIELRLGESGVTVSGRVLDEGGGPIPGAVVTTELGYPWNAALLAGAPQRQFVAISDDQGRYQLTLERREYALRARASGYVPAETTVAVTRAVSRDLRLSPAARVAGLAVETGSGNPVAEAEVLLVGAERSGGAVSVARTDAEGRFLIDDARAGAMELSIRHRGRNLFGSKRVVTVATQALEGLQVELTAGVRLAGRVRDPAGAGIAGVALSVYSSDVGVENARLVSGKDGAFAVALGAPGRYRLRAEAAIASDPRAELNLAVGPQGLDTAEVVLARSPEALVVVGRIVSASGNVPGALVRAQVTEGGRTQQVGTAESDASGAFRIEGVPGKPLRLLGWHPTEGVGDVQITPSPSASAPTTELRLQAGATLGGVVRFEDGAPAPGMSVAVTGQSGVVVYDSDTTGSDGRYTLTSLAPGRYTVRATRKTGPFNHSTSRERPNLRIVEVAAGEKRDDVHLELKRGGHLINGTAKLPDGQPAVGAQVVANRYERGRTWKPSRREVEHQATVDDQGRFTLDDVEDEEFALWATLPGFPDAQAGEVRAGRGDVVLAFPVAARISGTVVDKGGQPVTVFHLSAVPTEASGETPEQRDRRAFAERAAPERVRDEQGAFLVDGLREGAYELKVTTADGSGVARQTITLAGGEHREGVRVVAGDGVSATGRVVELETGKPVANLTVRSRIAARYVEVKTGADGVFTLAGLVPGDTAMIETIFLPHLVPEFVEFVTPRDVASVDLGTWKLMSGDWQAAARHGGTVGLRMGTREGKPVVVAAAPGRPAAAAGVREGDLLLAIDGREVTALGAGATTYLTRRPPGSKLTLTVKSPGGDARVLDLTTVKQ